MTFICSRLEKEELFGLIYSALKPREVFVKDGHKYKQFSPSLVPWLRALKVYSCTLPFFIFIITLFRIIGVSRSSEVLLLSQWGSVVFVACWIGSLNFGHTPLLYFFWVVNPKIKFYVDEGRKAIRSFHGCMLTQKGVVSYCSVSRLRKEFIYLGNGEHSKLFRTLGIQHFKLYIQDLLLEELSLFLWFWFNASGRDFKTIHWTLYQFCLWVTVLQHVVLSICSPA